MLNSCKQGETSVNSNVSYEERLDEYLKLTGQQVKDNPLLNDLSALPMFGKINANNKHSRMMDTLMTEMEVKIKEIYKKELSDKDLNELIVFYKSPLGQKLIALNRTVGIETFKLTTESTMKRMQGIMENTGLNAQRDVSK